MVHIAHSTSGIISEYKTFFMADPMGYEKSTPGSMCKNRRLVTVVQDFKLFGVNTRIIYFTLYMSVYTSEIVGGERAIHADRT